MGLKKNTDIFWKKNPPAVLEKETGKSFFAKRIIRRKSYFETGYQNQYHESLLQAPLFNPVACVRRRSGKRIWTVKGVWNEYTSRGMLEFITKGTAAVIIDGNEYSFKKGDILIGRHNHSAEKWIFPGVYESIQIVFACGMPESYLLALACKKSSSPTVLSAPFSDEFLPQFEELYRIVEKNEENAAFDCSSLIYSILINIIRKQQHPNTNIYHRMLGILESYAFKHYDLDELAKACGMSRRKLNNYFRKTMQMTPLEYIRSVRMSYAATFLLTNDISVKEIAEMCTYTNASYFCRDFKLIHGMTPVQYRKKKRSLV